MDLQSDDLLEFFYLVKKLRAECPWDREQTINSLQVNIIEESNEIAESIRKKDIRGIEEELGDLLLVITMIAEIGSEKEYFNIKSVVNRIKQKIIFRHPHIFSNQVAENPEQVKKIWKQMKKIESSPDHIMAQAVKEQEDASQLGFDWPDVKGVYDKLEEEIAELKQTRDYNKQVEELGDILFVVVHLANHLKIDPEIALQHTVKKFKTRFRHVQQQMKRNKIAMSKDNLEIMEKYWREKAEQEK